MYIFQAPAVIKQTFLISFIFFVVFQGFSQTAEDSAALLKNAHSFLEKKIDFSWRGGSLAEACSLLTSQYQVKFAYADDKLTNIHTGRQTFLQTPLAEVMETLLLNTGLRYIVIGRTIVIVPSKNNDAGGNTDPDKEKQDALSESKKAEQHLYAGPSGNGELSPYEQRLLKSIYGKELKQQMLLRRKRNLSPRDTSEKKAVAPPPSHAEQKRFYLRASGGWENFYLKYKNNNALDWQRDLKFHSSAQPAFSWEAETGIFIKSLMLGTGIGLHRLSVEKQFLMYKPPAPPAPPGPAPGPTPPPAPPPKMQFIHDTYSLISVPIRVGWIKQWKRFYFSPGAGLNINFIGRKPPTDSSINEYISFRDYYRHAVPEKEYTEKKHNVSYSILLTGFIGFRVNSRFIVSSSIDYNACIRPFFESPIYRMYPNMLSIRLSLFYRFDFPRKSGI